MKSAADIRPFPSGISERKDTRPLPSGPQATVTRPPAVETTVPGIAGSPSASGSELMILSTYTFPATKLPAVTASGEGDSPLILLWIPAEGQVKSMIQSAFSIFAA